jgi:hypothetical protein
MAEQQGGYRRPRKPAPVSGPASMSRRTDDGRKQAVRYMAGGQYGEGKKILEQQQGAPMAGRSETPMPRPATPAPNVVPEEPVVGMLTPTQRPNEPITYGSDFGPGAGSEILNLQNQNPNIYDIMEQLIQSDPTGEAQLIYTFLSDRNF